MSLVRTRRRHRPRRRCQPLRRRANAPPDLPGCEPIPLPASELDTFESRLEVWDGRTETAWVCEPVTIYHEQPTRRLSWVTSRIALVRGSPIRYIGSADLVQRNAAGRERWIMQADEVLYLHPGRVRVSKRVVEVDTNDLPDVVLEVDHSTDVRQWKLGMYQERGFPEIWVLVPWEESVRTPGMTIHVRGTNGGYREAGRSIAFPGWTAEEIHTALTEEMGKDSRQNKLFIRVSAVECSSTPHESDPVAKKGLQSARPSRGAQSGTRCGPAPSEYSDPCASSCG